MSGVALARRALLAAPALLAFPVRAQAKPVVVASVPVVGDVAAQIVGERATVRVLAAPDQDPSAFQPTPEAIEGARNATLVLRNGLGLEPWLDKLLRAARNTAPVITATERLTPIMYNGIPDPIAWQHPLLVRTYVLNVADALYRAMPSGMERDLRLGAAAMMSRLARLDEDIKAELRVVPLTRQVIVSDRGGLRYFSAAYSVVVVSVPEPGPDGVVPPNELGVLVRRLRAERITALMRAPYGSHAVMDYLAAQIGGRVSGPLYVDTLSPPDGPAPTYEAMMRHNVRLMVSAMLAQ